MSQTVQKKNNVVECFFSEKLTYLQQNQQARENVSRRVGEKKEKRREKQMSA